MRSIRRVGAWRRATRARLAIGGGAIALAVTLLLPASAALAAPPGSETVDRSGTLETAGQSMWQAGSGGGPEEKTVNVFNQKWNDSAKGGGITKVAETFTVCNVWKTTEEAFEKFFTKGEVTTECSEYKTFEVDIGEFGAEGEASTNGEIGMSLKLHGFASGSLGVTYPVTAHYTIPQEYSFAAGEEVTIGTSESVDHTAALKTAFPTLEGVALEGVFGFHAGAKGKLCVFACTSESLLELNLPSGYNGSNPSSGQIFELKNPGTACFDFIANFALGFGHAPPQYDRCHNEETGVNSGYIALPNVKTESTLGSDGSLTAEGEDPYVVVPVSAVTWAARLLPGGKPPPLNFGPAKIPGTEITLGYETLQLLLTDVEKMKQVFTFTPQVDTTLEWGQSMSYVVKNGKGEVVSEGTAEEATFPLGDTLTLTTPSSLRGQLTIKPKLSMGKAEISNHTENLNIGEGKFSGLSLTLDTPSAEYGKVTIWPGSKLNLGPLFNEEFPLATTSEDIANGKWTLAGFNQPSLDPLTLTPDPPPVPTPVTVHPVEGLPFEGVIAKFTDPEPSSDASDYAVNIKWGDGAEEEGSLTEVEVNEEGTVFTVTAKHTYAEEGEYPVDVTIKDIDSPALVVTDESTAVVSDAPLYAKPHLNTTTNTGKEALLWPQPPSHQTLATFTDEDPGGTLTDYSASIAWGDGATTAGEILETQPGSKEWEVRGEHVYSPEDLGPHVVTVTISDAGGSKVVQEVPVVAYAFSENGDFAIAPAAPGDAVTFWSAQWAKDNAILDAPASFKGWVDSGATPPACEGAWASAPGNSSNPPAQVPAYMAVLETSSVGKQGARIEGQTSGLAIVAVAPGYGPNPGHAGLGEVIAQACP